MLLTIKEVAGRLKLKYDTVYWNYIRNGKIKSIRLNRMYRVREEALEEFLKNSEYEPNK